MMDIQDQMAMFEFGFMSDEDAIKMFQFMEDNGIYDKLAEEYQKNPQYVEAYTKTRDILIDEGLLKVAA